MAFPAWTSELEAELRDAYQHAAPELADGGSRHTGLRAVYELLLDKASTPQPPRLPNGPWDAEECYQENWITYDGRVPPPAWPYP